ncbi:hypothetical protein F4777DRAFT_547329 [Nemania sp. FL0916]|nr:hypothetical protein F4777DRAFT_547329 [Nemania sp. FL0916]
MDFTRPATAVVTNSLSQCEIGNRASVNVAILLDGLIKKLDQQPIESFPLPNFTQRQNFGGSLSSAPRFADLPPEIRLLIFEFCFCPFVITIYHDDWQNVKNSPEANIPNLANSRIMCIKYRSPRTIPLLHVCQASRHLALRRYGLPTPDKLLFDPTIDQICHSGEWPFATVKPWHIFGFDKEPICDFSKVTSMQLQLSTIRPDVDICYPPGSMFGMTSYLAYSKSLVRYSTDILQTLDWIQDNTPHLREIIFTLSALHIHIVRNIHGVKDRARTDIANICTALVYLGERANCLGELKEVGLYLV